MKDQHCMEELALWCKIMQDNAAQQWCYSTILAPNTISNTVKFAKMIHPDFFDEDGGRKEVLITLTLILLDNDEDTGDQNSKPSTLPYPIAYTQCIIITYIAFCQPLSMHCLQSTFTKVRKENAQLGSTADHNGTGWQSHQNANRLVVIMTIDICESPIDNIIFNEPSSPTNHSSKYSDIYACK